MEIEIVESDDPIGLDTYGYPKVCFVGRKHVRISYGWFFPREFEDEPACYMDFYVDEHGEVSVLLDWTGIIFFDFITPLDEYLLPGSKTRTIGDLYKEEKKC